MASKKESALQSENESLKAKLKVLGQRVQDLDQELRQTKEMELDKHNSMQALYKEAQEEIKFLKKAHKGDELSFTTARKASHKAEESCQTQFL